MTGPLGVLRYVLLCVTPLVLTGKPMDDNVIIDGVRDAPEW